MAEENKSIGALWEKKSGKGTWFSGSIETNGEKIQIVVFKNDYKKEEKHPDYKIFVSKPKENHPVGNNQESTYKSNQEVKQEEETDLNELPF